MNRRARMRIQNIQLPPRVCGGGTVETDAGDIILILVKWLDTWIVDKRKLKRLQRRARRAHDSSGEPTK